MAKSTKKEEKRIIEQMRSRFKLMLEADQRNRRNAMEDMKFINVPGRQWDDNMKKQRGDRPCYEFNKLRVTCKRIINDMRANRAQGKVRPVEGGDKGVAEIIEGLCRNIENISDFETVADYAAEYQVSAGMGAWRIETDYTTDTMFEQDIQISEIMNPFCLFSDPSSRDMLKRDAADWILTEKMPQADYERQYGDKEMVEFESHEFDDDEEWHDSEEVRVAEYWYKEPVKKEIWQLSNGQVVDAETDEALAIEAQSPEAIVKRRTVDTNKIMMVLASGDAILEGPTEWAGSMFPFIPVYGEYMVVDGVTQWYGAGRWGKDAQRSYNVSRTAITESIAMQPQSKYWVTSEQAKGHIEKWAEAHQKNFPVMLYNPDPKAPGAPQRMGSADVPIALIQESQLASEEISMVTGIYAHDVGAPNAASSGRQEAIRANQGQIATFNYQDNMAKAKKRTWEILLDLVPKIYDTERELRILGSDGAEDYKTVNQFVLGPNGEQIKINDLSLGKYDTTITVGPSFSTRREEAAETYQAMLQGNPQVFPLIGDLIFKSMDLPYSEDIADRLKTMLPPEIRQTLEGEQEQSPEVMAAMQQAQQAMQMVQQQAQEVQQAAQETEMAKTEVEKLMADLQAEQSKFEAKVAKETAGLVKAEAGLVKHEAAIDTKIAQANSDGIVDEGRQKATQEAAQFSVALAEDTASVLQNFQAVIDQLNQHAISAVDGIRAEKDSRKVVKVRATRENGELVAVPEYEDENETLQ